MKTIGLIGGMSWEASAEYYRIINEAVRDRLGGSHSCKSLMFTVDFAEIETLQQQGRWSAATDIMIAVAQQLEVGGADCVLICANTMHKMADEVQAAIHIPLLHIADATGEAVKATGLHKLGLLGTRYTMEQDFLTGRLTKQHGLEILVPGPDERTLVHQVIYEELILGKINPASRAAYLSIIDGLARNGAEGIILGCTEIGLLIKQEDCALPLFDTTPIHALAGVDFALAAE
jgi:aspartate racemase